MENAKIFQLNELSEEMKTAKISPLLTIGDVIRMRVPAISPALGNHFISVPCLLNGTGNYDGINVVEVIPMCPDLSREYMETGDEVSPVVIAFQGPFEAKHFDSRYAAVILAGSGDLQNPQIVAHLAGLAGQ